MQAVSQSMGSAMEGQLSPIAPVLAPALVPALFPCRSLRQKVGLHRRRHLPRPSRRLHPRHQHVALQNHAPPQWCVPNGGQGPLPPRISHHCRGGRCTCPLQPSCLDFDGLHREYLQGMQGEVLWIIITVNVFFRIINWSRRSVAFRDLGHGCHGCCPL